MLTVTSEGDYGGLFFSADIPPAEQEGLAHEIEAFDHASIDRQFSCGQWDGRPVGATGCEAFVEKRWHQEPHFTVQLLVPHARGLVQEVRWRPRLLGCLGNHPRG